MCRPTYFKGVSTVNFNFKISQYHFYILRASVMQNDLEVFKNFEVKNVFLLSKWQNFHLKL